MWSGNASGGQPVGSEPGGPCGQAELAEASCSDKTVALALLVPARAQLRAVGPRGCWSPAQFTGDDGPQRSLQVMMMMIP